MQSSFVKYIASISTGELGTVIVVYPTGNKLSLSVNAPEFDSPLRFAVKQLFIIEHRN